MSSGKKGVVLIPITTVEHDLITQTDTVVHIPLATRNSHGIVRIGEGLFINDRGDLSFDRNEITVKHISKNGVDIQPDLDRRVNITLNKDDVGLNNVDNTSDLEKPISNAARQEMLRLESLISDASKVTSVNGKIGVVSLNQDDIYDGIIYKRVTSEEKQNWNNKLSSYTETDPTVPAWAKQPNKPTYQYNEIEDLPNIPSVDGLASETYVDNKIAGLVNSAPETLDTLGELATALKENEDVVKALNESIGNKANKSDIPDISGKADKTELADYLPLTAGKDKGLTGNLYANGGIILPNNVAYKSIDATTGGEVTLFRLAASNAIIVGETSGKYDLATYSRFRPVGNKATLGDGGYQWKEIHGEAIYQDGKQVANKEDIPTNISDLTNDSGYVIEEDVVAMVGDLGSLNTTNSDNLVLAINEINTKIGWVNTELENILGV